MAGPRECVRCGEIKKIVGRGLCSACYQFLEDHEGLEDYPTRSQSGKWIETWRTSEGVETRQCTRCKEWKPLDGFYKSTQLKSGYESWCKSCRVEKSRGRYAPIKQEVRSKRQERYQGNLKQCNVCEQWRPLSEFSSHSYHWDKLSHICKSCKRVQGRTYARKPRNRRVRQGNNKRWYLEHKEQARAKSKEWRQRNPDKSREIWYRYKARKLNAEGSFTADQWRAIVNHYCPDGRCLCCGEHKKLTQDHVVPLSRGGSNSIDNIQPICQPCNSSKCNLRTTDYRPDDGAFAKSLLINESIDGS